MSLARGFQRAGTSLGCTTNGSGKTNKIPLRKTQTAVMRIVMRTTSRRSRRRRRTQRKTKILLAAVEVAVAMKIVTLIDRKRQLHQFERGKKSQRKLNLRQVPPQALRPRAMPTMRRRVLKPFHRSPPSMVLSKRRETK